jgi:hypothetical protein
MRTPILAPSAMVAGPATSISVAWPAAGSMVKMVLEPAPRARLVTLSRPALLICNEPEPTLSASVPPCAVTAPVTLAPPAMVRLFAPAPNDRSPVSAPACMLMLSAPDPIRIEPVMVGAGRLAPW